MDTRIVFKTTPPDPAQLGQISSLLRARTDSLSRESHPKLWQVTDSLTAKAGGGSPAQKKLWIALPVFNWTLGMVLLMAGLKNPKELLFAEIIGACAAAGATILLWRRKRGLAAVLNLAAGGLLTLGAVLDRGELGCFLMPGMILLMAGIAALSARHQPPRPTSFDQSARRLLEELGKQPSAAVAFTEDGMELPGEIVPYPEFEGVFESEELCFVVWGEQYLLLQKKDLAEETMEGFRELLSQKVKMHSVQPL